MKNIITCISFFIIMLVSTNMQGQYNHAIGLRGGETSGLTYKYLNGNAAVEGIFGFYKGGISVTVLFERYAQAFGEPGFNWYYGGGGHIAFWDGYRGGGRWGNRYDDHYDADMAFGIDGIVGLEYKIPPIPFAISVDIKPFIEMNTDGGVGFWLDPGLGVKFAF